MEIKVEQYDAGKSVKISGEVPKRLQVAVGVVKDNQGRVLISLRDKSLHQGGLWEFPGGKIEVPETPEQALARELKEELDITVIAASPLITINYQYPDVAVQLNVFLVEHFSGDPKSCEGQPFKWVNPEELTRYAFPAANQPIITAAQLPPYYAILDDAEDEARLLINLQKILNKDIKLIQARLKTLSAIAIKNFLDQAYPLCRQRGAVLLINSAVAQTASFSGDGIHLTSRHLMAADKRPPDMDWVAASCHNCEELLQAQKIGVDFVVLAPVLSTQTHPETEPLGWESFAELVAQVNLPVYALGGLSASSLMTACRAGAQGVAGIRAFLC
ncbi:MAG: Nudix family hydrolase [Methylovulum sp.]